MAYFLAAVAVILAIFMGDTMAHNVLSALPLGSIVSMLLFSFMAILSKSSRTHRRATWTLVAVLLLVVGDLIQKQGIAFPPLLPVDIFHVLLFVTQLVLCHVATLGVF